MVFLWQVRVVRVCFFSWIAARSWWRNNACFIYTQHVHVYFPCMLSSIQYHCDCHVIWKNTYILISSVSMINVECMLRWFEYNHEQTPTLRTRRRFLDTFHVCRTVDDQLDHSFLHAKPQHTHTNTHTHTQTHTYTTTHKHNTHTHT